MLGEGPTLAWASGVWRIPQVSCVLMVELDTGIVHRVGLRVYYMLTTNLLPNASTRTNTPHVSFRKFIISPPNAPHSSTECERNNFNLIFLI